VFLQQLAKRNNDLPCVGTDVVISGLVLTLTLRNQTEQPPQPRCLVLCPRWGWHFQANEAVRVQADLHTLVHPHAGRCEELYSEQTEGARSREAVNRDEHRTCFDRGIFVEPLVPTCKTPGQESSNASVQWAVIDPSVLVRVAPLPKPRLPFTSLLDCPVHGAIAQHPSGDHVCEPEPLHRSVIQEPFPTHIFNRWAIPFVS